MEEGEDDMVWCMRCEVIEVNLGELGGSDGTNGLVRSGTLAENGKRW